MVNQELLKGRIPEEFLAICIDWWEKLGFEMKLNRHRTSKLGDYRYHSVQGSHIITVNHTLAPWSFLITYTHEVAHCKVYKDYGPGLKHHGREWKREFRTLLLELLSTGNIPDKLARVLATYAKNPRASTYSYIPLVQALRDMESTKEYLLLSELDPGNSFIIAGVPYTFLDKRRTRALCRQNITGRKYLISLVAEVEIPA